MQHLTLKSISEIFSYFLKTHLTIKISASKQSKHTQNHFFLHILCLRAEDKQIKCGEPLFLQFNRGFFPLFT